jgi:F-type H+-transporting ATPase subunit b
MLLEALGKIGFDYKLAIANAINFVIIFYLLKKYFFGPLGKSIEERKKRVEETIISQEMAKNALESAKQKEEEILRDAYEKAKRVTDKAEVKGKDILEHFQNEAILEKNRIIREGYLDVEKREKEARVRVQEEASDLIVSTAEKLIDKKLNDEDRREYILKMSNK